MVAIASKDSLYVENLLPKSEAFFETLEAYAVDNRVPIIDKISISYLSQLLKIKKAKNILEIGTAIAYSAIRLCEETGANVVTIERDDKMYQEAVKNVTTRLLNDKISLIHSDALILNDEVIQKAPYDVVFIDGAKSQSRKFFELYEPYFAKDVLVITDNVLFKGMVADPSIIEHSRDLKQLSRKINAYNEWLMTHSHYETTILPFGDGMAISIRK